MLIRRAELSEGVVEMNDLVGAVSLPGSIAQTSVRQLARAFGVENDRFFAVRIGARIGGVEI